MPGTEVVEVMEARQTRFCQDWHRALRKEVAPIIRGRVGLMGFPGSSAGRESACNAGDQVRFLGWEDPLEKG